MSGKLLKVLLPCAILGVFAGMIAYSRGTTEFAGKTVVRISVEPSGYESLRNEWDAVIADFEKANPAIKVIPVRADWNKIALMTAAKMLPDIYGSNTFNMFRERMRAEDLTPYIKRDRAEVLFDDFIPEVIGDCNYDGKTYMLPWFFNIALLYYNVSVFREQGVDPPNDNWKWDDYVVAAQKLAKFDKNGKQIRWGTNVVWGWWEEWLTDINMCGGRIFNDNWDRCLLDTPESIQGLTYYRDKVLKFKVSSERSHTGHVPQPGDRDAMGRPHDGLARASLAREVPMGRGTAARGAKDAFRRRTGVGDVLHLSPFQAQGGSVEAPEVADEPRERSTMVQSGAHTGANVRNQQRVPEAKRQGQVRSGSPAPRECAQGHEIWREPADHA